MLQDLSDWIIGRMRIMKKSQAYMGELLGISQAAFGQKARSANFKYSELLTVLKELQATDEEILKFMRL
jgi:hypothetical protein